jgi:hypothetical protein
MCVSGVVCLMGKGTDMYNEERSSGPSAITEDLKVRVNDHDRENRRFSTEDLHENFPRFTICLLWECRNSTPKQKHLCYTDCKNSHRWTQTEEVKEAVTDWLNGLVADLHDEGIVKPVQRLGKCLNRNGG